MKMKNFIILAVALFAATGIYLYALHVHCENIKAGNYFTARVMQGCSLVRSGADGGEFEITEDMLNYVTVEYGIPSKGTERGTLRDFCEEYGTEKCESYVTAYCGAQ